MWCAETMKTFPPKEDAPVICAELADEQKRS